MLCFERATFNFPLKVAELLSHGHLELFISRDLGFLALNLQDLLCLRRDGLLELAHGPEDLLLQVHLDLLRVLQGNLDVRHRIQSKMSLHAGHYQHSGKYD